MNKQFDIELEEMLNEEVHVPKSVMDKAEQAFQEIRSYENSSSREKSTKWIFKLLKYSITAASLVIVYAICINAIPALAISTQKIPILSKLTQVLEIYYDKNMQNAVNNGFNQEINQYKISNGIKLSIDNIISDDRKAVIIYTISKEDKNITNLLIKNLRVTDEEDNLIIDSSSNYGLNEERKSYTANRKAEFHILNIYNYKQKNSYKGTIMTADDFGGIFEKTGETRGLIEITNDNKKMQIPDILNLDFTKLVEAYPESGNNLNENPNDYNYNTFKSKYNRDPITVDGDWRFSIKLDKDLKHTKPTILNNIKFNAYNIQFNIEYLKIYPTTTDVKLTYNYIGDEPISIMNSHLEDDKGNKFDILDYSVNTAEKVNYITFESPYFRNSNHLYLVVNEIQVGDPDQNPDWKKNIDRIKIKLK